jgi:thiamine biosynthesis lipoprotein
MIHTTEFKAMGCRIFAAIDHPNKSSPIEMENLPEWFEDWENIFSRFRSDSELSRINQSSGRPIKVSKTFWDVLKVSEKVERESSNLVTPAIHDQLIAAGYDTSFDGMPDNIQGSARIDNPGTFLLSDGQIDSKTMTVRLPENCRLDFGGVAKGWAAHQAAQRLKRSGPALVNSGGDIAITGRMSDGSCWSVGVANPDSPSENLEVLKLGRCGVATSGTDYRRWKKDDVWQHHIIDPRTGLPANTDILSATVVAANVMEAEMNAKVAVILGGDDASNWLEDNPSVAGILVYKTGKVVYSRRMQNYLWRKNDRPSQ